MSCVAVISRVNCWQLLDSGKQPEAAPVGPPAGAASAPLPVARPPRSPTTPARDGGGQHDMPMQPEAVAEPVEAAGTGTGTGVPTDAHAVQLEAGCDLTVPPRASTTRALAVPPSSRCDRWHWQGTSGCLLLVGAVLLLVAQLAVVVTCTLWLAWASVGDAGWDAVTREMGFIMQHWLRVWFEVPVDSYGAEKHFYY